MIADQWDDKVPDILVPALTDMAEMRLLIGEILFDCSDSHFSRLLSLLLVCIVRRFSFKNTSWELRFSRLCDIMWLFAIPNNAKLIGILTLIVV